MDKVRFIFETIGTRGDVAPLVAVAREVRRRGFDATLLAPSIFGADAVEHELEFVPITDQHLDKVGQVTFDDFYFPAFQPVVDYFDRARRCGQPLVVVNIDKTATSNLLCERDGLLGARLHLTPFKLRSFISPPWPYAARALGPDREHYLRHVLPRFFDACDRHPALLAHINARRRALGLGPATSATPNEPHLVEQVCLFPREYCLPPLDWPLGLKMLSFPLPEPGGVIPERLQAFLDAGPPPLVFTTGTGVHDVREFFSHARACCSLLGRRGVFLSPHLPSPESEDRAILQIDYADLGLVLPRCALLVHHGGIGTVARALSAGIPQIVSPLKYDQPDNAHRVEALGLGARLEREHLNARSLAALVQRLLSAEWPRRRLLALTERIQAHDAIGECASLLERVAHSALTERPRASSFTSRGRSAALDATPP
jgi:rhamnosyltransferase subunit B